MDAHDVSGWQLNIIQKELGYYWDQRMTGGGREGGMMDGGRGEGGIEGWREGGGRKGRRGKLLSTTTQLMNCKNK